MQSLSYIFFPFEQFSLNFFTFLLEEGTYFAIELGLMEISNAIFSQGCDLKFRGKEFRDITIAKQPMYVSRKKMLLASAFQFIYYVLKVFHSKLNYTNMNL